MPRSFLVKNRQSTLFQKPSEDPIAAHEDTNKTEGMKSSTC